MYKHYTLRQCVWYSIWYSIWYIIYIGKKMKIENQKITAYIPKELLGSAQNITGRGITETLKFGLEKVLQTQNYQKLGKLYGKYKANINLKELREDR